MARDDAHGWNCALFIHRNLKPKKVAVLNEKTAEATNILLTAIEKAAKSGKLTRKEIIKRVGETKNYRGMLGFPVTFNKKGDLEGGATYIFQVVGKDFKQAAVMAGK